MDLQEDTMTFSACFSKITSSYRIETLAFKKLLEVLFGLPPHIRRVRIFSDSLSLFLALTHLHIRASYLDPIWSDILSRISGLCEIGIEVSLHWIRGHSGIKGNEIADKLCTQAFQIPEPNWIPDSTHAAHFNQKISQHPLFSWNSVKSLNGFLRRVIFRSYLNHGLTRNLTHHFSGNPNAYCRYCFETIETVHHLLFDCNGLPNGPPLKKVSQYPQRGNVVANSDHWPLISQFLSDMDLQI